MVGLVSAVLDLKRERATPHKGQSGWHEQDTRPGNLPVRQLLTTRPPSTPTDNGPVGKRRTGTATVFGRTIQDVFKSNKEVGRLGNKESKKDTGCAESGENDHLAIPGGSQSVLAPSRLPGVMKEEETESRDKKEGEL